MTLNPKPPVPSPQTSLDLEGEPAAGSGGRAKSPWTTPRCRRLDLEETEAKLPDIIEVLDAIGVS